MTTDDTVNKTIESLKSMSEKRQLLLAHIDNGTVDQMLKRIQEADSFNLRQSKRLKETAVYEAADNINIDTTDSLMYKGMEGSLGYNLKKYATTSNAVKRKEKYFYYTCANTIIDISNPSQLSFFRSLPKEVSTKIVTEISCAKDIEYEDCNLPIQVLLNQVNNMNNLKKVLKEISNQEQLTNEQETTQEIYKFILNIHAKKPFMFHQERIQLYSENDYIVKFWSHIFETFFGYNERLFLHWGDTQAQACKKNNLNMRLDMRFMIMKNGSYIMDGSNCEYASKVTSSKLYKDRLKLVLGAKAYINEIIEGCPHLDEKDILDIQIPYLQIMGFRAILSVLRVKDKGVYVAEDLFKFSFPSTKKHIRSGQISNLVKALSLLKHLLNNLESLIDEGKVDNNINKMTNITEENSQAKVTNGEWISKIKVPSELDESVDEDEEDEENMIFGAQ